MFIASKFEEIYCPEIKDFAYVADNAYTTDQIFHFEGLILQELDFQLVITTSRSFLFRYAQYA